MGTFKTFNKGDKIIAAGTEPTNVFCIRRGQCSVTRAVKLYDKNCQRLPDGKIFLGEVKEYQCFGQSALLDKTTHHVTIHAATDLEVAVIPSVNILSLMDTPK